ncbi:hypothetical protein AB0F59_02405 [Micromonospora lupini]|uniref:hypothetical protein n=1 Tax=Micromonospora lupini TaxID=285679 RepID=UPI0033C47D7E
MPDTDLSEPVAHQLAEWIRKVNPQVTEVPGDLDIIETRTITSLQFVEFLLYIEQLRGAPIPPGIADINTFRTIRVIVDNYFRSPVEAGE